MDNNRILPPRLPPNLPPFQRRLSDPTGVIRRRASLNLERPGTLLGQRTQRKLFLKANYEHNQEATPTDNQHEDDDVEKVAVDIDIGEIDIAQVEEEHKKYKNWFLFN